jgi:pilus assembly protein CpaD
MASAGKDSKVMARITPLALVGISLGLTACGPETNRITPLSNPSLYVAHQPVVERTSFVYDLRSGFGGVSPDESARLAEWFASLGLRYGDRIYVDGADPQVRADIAKIVSGYGLLLSDGTPVTGEAGRIGGTRVVVARATASVPGCPLWEDELVGAPERAATNYGCATESNLANMIADPNDLVRGKDASSVTGADRANRSSADGPGQIGGTVGSIPN